MISFLKRLFARPAPAKPQTVAVTFREGGNWYEHPWSRDQGVVHSILFADGSSWDALNGWRPNYEARETLIRRHDGSYDWWHP